MVKRRTWPFVVVSIVLTPLLLYVALATAGAGHGTYFMAKVLFPYAMLAARTVNFITPTMVGLAVIQVPIYGLILAIGAKNARLFHVVAALAVVHMVAATACLALTAKGAFP